MASKGLLIFVPLRDRSFAVLLGCVQAFADQFDADAN